MEKSFQSVDKDKLECPICLEIINKNNSIIASCKHGWCKKCGENIQKNTCPICRKKLIGKTVQGHWGIRENQLIWISLEERVLKEKKEMEKKLKTKFYRKERFEKNIKGIMTNIILSPEHFNFI